MTDRNPVAREPAPQTTHHITPEADLPKKKTAGVSVSCPGLNGPCPICSGITVELRRPKQPDGTEPPTGTPTKRRKRSTKGT